MPVAGLILIAFFGLLGVVIVGAFRAEKRRLAQMQTAAQAMGFSYVEKQDDLPRGEFPLFNRGHARRVRNVMTGVTAGNPVELFDYQYTVGGGKNSHTHRQTVAVFTEPRRGLPDFELSPENVFHRIGAVFGYQDIDFDGNETFSKQYLLRGSDETAIRSAFGPTVQAFFTTAPGWSVETRGGQVLVYRASRPCPPAEVPSFLADCLRMVTAFDR